MTPTREEVIRVARECGLGTSLLPFEEIGDKGGIWLDGDFNYLDLIERLARHFYEAGTAAEREAERKARMSFGELHPANPNATCKCEHWQSCADCHPTAHDKATGEKA